MKSGRIIRSRAVKSDINFDKEVLNATSFFYAKMQIELCICPVFPHFLKMSSESIDFTEFIFENGCCMRIFGNVSAKIKE